MSDRNNKRSGGLNDPLKSISLVDPFKTGKEYKDPLRVPKKQYVDPVQSKPVVIPDVQPYNTVHEYTLPDIDPLTGKPFRRGHRRVKRTDENKASKVPHPKLYFPKQLGSTVGSTKRMLSIQDHLNI